MKAKKKAKRVTTRLKASIERWTLERLDRDAGMARIESVPMRSDCLTAELLDALSEKGLEKGMDQLSLWDVVNARIRRMPIGRLSKKLGIRPDEREALSENMVFWVLSPAGARKTEQVFHATRAARETTKDLYRKVAQSSTSVTATAYSSSSRMRTSTVPVRVLGSSTLEAKTPR